jgi:adenosylcobyric acid synthase
MMHGGNLRRLAQTAGKPEHDIIDFSANLNPLGPPEWFRHLISSNISKLAQYPDPESSVLLDAVAGHYGAALDEVIVGNGSSELLYLIPRLLGKRCVIPVPSYVDYARAGFSAGKEIVPLLLREEEGFALNLTSLESCLRDEDLVFIGQPNNPTGTVCEAEKLRELAQKRPAVTFAIDEAFADFAGDLGRMTRNRSRNVIVLLSQTKIFAMPGLRLGCAIADSTIIRKLRKLQPPWPVNALAQAVGAAALRDREYLERTRSYVCRQREILVRELGSSGDFTVYSGHANFLLMKINRPGLNASTLARELLAQGIAIRVCDNFEGLNERFFRVAVRTEEENLRLCALLGVRKKHPAKRKKPALMIQGTSSNAGKSILTAALCRIFLQDGFRIAPFKSQNMSLNSFVTRDGGEMGRAQVVQAQACRLEPDTRMNPILLKPASDIGSQVIVRGQPVGNMSVAEYIRFKPEAFRAAREAYDELADEYDAIVLEGAGSPGEVNLKSHDIVNMNMARYAGSPVLLVGDIDRGGVFASFVGTMEVLAEWERSLVAGFVVNRFRGQESLLKEALDYTRRHTGIPVLGVIPNIPELGLPEEDSVTFKCRLLGNGDEGHKEIEIAVIDLPYISNFTDFDAFKNEPDVSLRIVTTVQDLGNPDAIILPGSKNVLEDLAYLRHKGLDQAIAHRDQATEIVGICGGYQMLGTVIEDAHAIESSRRKMRGLGLLALSTSMAVEKTLVQTSATHISGLRLNGYEIHHGQSRDSDLQPVVLRTDGAIIGVGRSRVWGTYLHGIFDADEFRRWFIDRLRERKGLSPLGRVCAPYDLEPALDRLAAVVRESIQLEAVYKLMGLK